MVIAPNYYAISPRSAQIQPEPAHSARACPDQAGRKAVNDLGGARQGGEGWEPLLRTRHPLAQKDATA